MTSYNFFNNRMSMSEVCQPLIIEYLLQNSGKASKTELARLMTISDSSVIEYYERILMTWPKKTLTKHGITVSVDHAGIINTYKGDVAGINFTIKISDISI